jgi:hypothetical protein
VVGGLQFLGLGHAAVGPAGVLALARSARLEPLQALDLSGNDLTAEALAGLTGSRHLRLLRWLDLAYCELKPEALRGLSHQAPPPHLASIESNGNPLLGDEGVEVLAGWPGLREVMRLNLEDTGMGDSGAEVLVGSPYTGCLCDLDVQFNQIGARGRKALLDGFPPECVSVDER